MNVTPKEAFDFGAQRKPFELVSDTHMLVFAPFSGGIAGAGLHIEQRIAHAGKASRPLAWAVIHDSSAKYEMPELVNAMLRVRGVHMYVEHDHLDLVTAYLAGYYGGAA